MSIEQRRRLAGEAIEIVKIGQLTHNTFFVEDRAHFEILTELAEVIGNEVTVIECGTSSNVKTFFRLSLKEDGWGDYYYLVDGDGEGNPFPDSKQFIHLDKYCIENYLLNCDIAAKVTGKSPNDIQRHIYESVKNSKDEILKRNKFFDFLFDRLVEKDLTEESLAKLDVSEILPGFLKLIEFDRAAYVREYIKEAHQQGALAEIFPKDIVDAIAIGEQ